jgi:hypothetical protein
MAVAAGVAAGVGLAALGAGTAAAIRAQRMNTKPRGVTYGGSQDAQDTLEEQNLQGIAQGNAQQVLGIGGLQGAAKSGQKLSGAGTSIMQSANRVAPVDVTNQGAAILGQYKPGAVAAAQAKQALDANTAASFGAARAGGALGLRNALNANASTGAQTAQALATQRAQEEQAYTAAQVAQANAAQQQAFTSDQQAAAQRAQLLGIGTQAQAAGNQAALQANSAITQAGLSNQNQWLGQEQNLNDQQAALNQAYETARRNAAQTKSDRLWNLGASFINTGTGALQKLGAG